MSTALIRNSESSGRPVLRSAAACPAPKHPFTRYSYLRRAVQVIGTFAPVILECWRDTRRFFIFGGERKLSEAHHVRRAARIRYKIERLGVSFIKVGQVVSTRGDVLPKVYLDALSTLQDSITPLPFEMVREELEATYGQSLASVFEKFSEVPLATASIGQVHQAQYRGQEVVVKLVRPGIRQLILMDYQLTQAILAFLGRQLVRFRLEKTDFHVLTSLFRLVIKEVHQGLHEEMDFDHERDNAERLYELLAHRPGVVIPRTVPELCRSNVLVLEYLEGTKITDMAKLRAQGFQALALVDQIVELYVEMMLVHGLYHADPHPGNIFINRNGDIILFDFGIVRTLSKETRDGLMKVVLAALREDLPSVVDQLYQLQIIDPQADREIALQVGKQFAEIHFQGLPTAKRIESVRQFVRHAFGYLPLHIPQELVYVFRVISMLEGLGTRFKPGWNMMADGRPAVRRAVGHMLMEAAPATWVEVVRSWATRWWKTIFG